MAKLDLLSSYGNMMLDIHHSFIYMDASLMPSLSLVSTELEIFDKFTDMYMF